MKNSKLPAFPSIPLNTKRVYTRGIASSGCEVYIPVASNHDNVIEARKKELQEYLDSQVPYEPPTLIS